jgi:hypothetical protein
MTNRIDLHRDSKGSPKVLNISQDDKTPTSITFDGHPPILGNVVNAILDAVDDGADLFIHQEYRFGEPLLLRDGDKHVLCAFLGPSNRKEGYYKVATKGSDFVSHVANYRLSRPNKEEY